MEADDAGTGAPHLRKWTKWISWQACRSPEGDGAIDDPCSAGRDLLATPSGRHSFGEALIAVPLLPPLIPVEEVVPLATLVSITVAVIAVAQDWHKIHVRSAGGGNLDVSAFPWDCGC